jgi:hypothetical protein
MITTRKIQKLISDDNERATVLIAAFIKVALSHFSNNKNSRLRKKVQFADPLGDF